MEKRTIPFWEILRAVSLVLFFAGAAVLGYWIFGHDNPALEVRNEVQQLLYPLGLGLLLAGLLTATLSATLWKSDEERPVWYYPVAAALLTLCGLGIAYVFLGIWPVGDETCLIVDMHHQYAPLLAKLRTMFIGGDSFLYSFDLGMGASVLPAFAYYLASPLNLLLVLFPEHLLAEGIFLITILKNMLIAAACALCLQYLYGERSPKVAAVSLFYSMMMYVLAYSWNIMWLDGLIALPLVVMGFEHLMRRGKYLPYVLSLAYALYANYYIAFMLCIFLVLYFFAFLLRQKREREANRRALWRFTAGSLLGGGIAMFLVLPTFLALGQTSAAGAGLPDMDVYFDLYDMLGRHLYQVSPTIRSRFLPNLYCGIAPLVLVPLFALNRGIPRRRRAAYLGLLAVMFFSLPLNQVNLLWHGLHSPNDLPYRFSFIYCFVLILLSYETLMHIRTVRPRQILAVLGAVLTYVMVEEKFGSSETYGFKTLYISLALAALYAALAYLMARQKVRRAVGSMLLLTLVTMEMTLNASNVMTQLNNQEFYSNHSGYVDNLTTEAVQDAVASLEKQAEKGGHTFTRVEFLPRRTCMDTALFQYSGITSFASSNSYRTTRFMGAMGYAVNGVNSYLYKSFIPMTDSLLGIRYVALENRLASHAQLTLVDTTLTVDKEDGETKEYYIYENKTALPLAWRADSTVKEWASSYYNPVVSINGLYASMTGNLSPVLVPMQIEPYADHHGVMTVNGTYGFRLDGGVAQRGDLRAAADADGQYFLYVDCRGADSISVTQGDNSWSVTTHEPFFIDAGYLTAGSYATVTVTSDTTCSGNVYMLRMDEAVFNAAIASLSADGMTVTEFDDARIRGKINASAAGAMVTSIPYDAGWRVKVDGKTVKTYPLDQAIPDGVEEEENVGGALLGFDIGAGEHTVELVFVPQGFAAGVILSLLSLALLIAAALFTGRCAPRVSGTRFAWVFDTTDVDAPTVSAEEEACALPTEETADDLPADEPVLGDEPSEAADETPTDLQEEADIAGCESCEE
ncbi:MAG: hypothetical protein E7549_03345 [Ruminococcaceae bacterium]|nr:hypothetical protein [Oscillospiraceae bacterium]